MTTHRTLTLARLVTRTLATLAWTAAATSPAWAAWELSGVKTVRAHTTDQQVIELGQVTFTPQADGRVGFQLTMNSARFGDHFLSMKEFKCLEGATELLCHVPYPYAQPGTVTAQDFGWLEHSLLFLFKKPGEFSAKLWNGLYYRLSLTETGLKGSPQAIDLNRISAPPDNPAVPPYKAAYRDDIAPGARWVEKLTIE